MSILGPSPFDAVLGQVLICAINKLLHICAVMSAKWVMFSPVSVCLFVCRSVCLSVKKINKKLTIKYLRNGMEWLGMINAGINRLVFGGNLDPDQDSGIF